MRAQVLIIWFFINLIFFGMCGYMYVLLSQYWKNHTNESDDTSVSSSMSIYDKQIYYYNRGYSAKDLEALAENGVANKNKEKQQQPSPTILKTKPRFPNFEPNVKHYELDSRKFRCTEDEQIDCDQKTLEYKAKVLQEMRRVLEDEGNVLKQGTENQYNVEYKGTRSDYQTKSSEEILCELKKIGVDMVTSNDILDPILEPSFPDKPVFSQHFEKCAIVASSGALKDSKLGQKIDAHDLVLRFNNAPTEGFVEDVGEKTTIRILNSQVVTKLQYEFLTNDIYKNTTLILWDPSEYNATLHQWLRKPEFNFLAIYHEFASDNPGASTFVLNPRTIWRLWELLQANTPVRLRKNPVSSGFLGLAVLLPFCKYVDIFEYVPSSRATKRCHYYDAEENPACTFGIWHPLSAEKLLAYHMNIANDKTVFHEGFVRIKGYSHLKHCK